MTWMEHQYLLVSRGLNKKMLTTEDVKTNSIIEMVVKLANQTRENTLIIEYLVNEGIEKEIRGVVLNMINNGELK